MTRYADKERLDKVLAQMWALIQQAEDAGYWVRVEKHEGVATDPVCLYCISYDTNLQPKPVLQLIAKT
jgi:hypothetical protein